MSHASHLSGPVTLARNVTLRPVSDTTTTPQDIIETLLQEADFRSVADIARSSGWNYQRIHRWAKGSVGDISQDDIADLLTDLGRDPEYYSVRPSLHWRRKHAAGGANAEEMPPWFRHYAEQQREELRQIRELIELLVDRR